MPVDEAQIREADAEPGYAGPVGINVLNQNIENGVQIVGDLLIEKGFDFVTAANKPGLHFEGVNYPREFIGNMLAEVPSVKAGG